VTIERIIDELTRVNGVNVVSLCSRDGIPIASQAPVGTADQDRIAAMSAEIGQAVHVLSSSWDGAGFAIAAFEASSGKLVVADVEKAYLAVLSDQAANTGLLRLSVERASGQLREALSAPT